MRALLTSVLVLYINQRVGSQAVPRPAIRVRINKGIFEQASTIVAGLVEYEVPRIRVPSTQQCFPEGCVQIHSLQVTGFRQPSLVSFGPYPPNQFIIRITDFDFFIAGQLGGTISIIIQLPVVGRVQVTGVGISVAALFDIQKSVNDEPYLRMTACQIDGGRVQTRVADVGLLTDTINGKYQEAMSASSKAQIEESICENVYRLTQQHFSSHLAKLPTHVSATSLFKTFLNVGGNARSPVRGPNPQRRTFKRTKRASEDYYDDIESTDKKSSAVPARSSTSTQTKNIPRISITPQDISRSFNVDRLRHIMIDLTLLDASATRGDFSVGMSGIVTSTKSNEVSPYHPPFPFRLPQNTQRRMAEIAISEYTVNSLLYHAHRTNSLLFHADSHSPGLGNILKTTCTVDEVCLSDQVEEIGKAYPGQRLEIIIRTTQPPTVRFYQDEARLSLDGRCLFFLEGTRRKIGVIPFSIEALIRLQTVGSVLKGRITITKFSFNRGADFFGLSVEDLDGLRKTTKTAIENMTNGILGNGIPLSASNIVSSLRLSAIHVSVAPGAALLQANVDLYSSFYNHS
ncbi:hypothetical protein V3C99_015169 [Haemonchus contortus]